MNRRAPRAAVAAMLAAAALVVPAMPAHADQIRDNQWHLRFLNVTQAHNVSQGDGVTVAVIDSGVDPHPDLRNNLLPGTDLVAGGSGDGREDTNGHGTGMAGLIAAHGRSGGGALGVAPKAKILPIRVESSEDSGTNTDVAEGIEWALAHGAKVISVSSSGGPSPALRDAVNAAIAADVVIVAGVGNRPGDVSIGFPAFIEGVLAVGACDKSGSRAPVSVAGEQLALLAPGVDIMSTSKQGNYRQGTGTSPATAIVAGAAALVRSKYPNLSAPEVVHRLTATATDKGPQGRDPQYGFGVLNLVAALTADVPPLQPTGSPSGPNPSPTGATAGPRDNSGSGSAGLVVGLLVLVLLAAGGAVAVVIARRRTPSAPKSET